MRCSLLTGTEIEQQGLLFEGGKTRSGECETSAEPEKDHGEERHREKTETEGRLHRRVREASAALADDGRVIAAPLLHGVMDDGEVHGAEDTERRRKLPLGVAVPGEAAAVHY